MSPRNLHLQSLYLDPKKAALLDRLSEDRGVPKAVLLREAVDDLLEKNERLLKGPGTVTVAIAALVKAKQFAIAVLPQLRGRIWTDRVIELQQELDAASGRLSAFQAGRSRA